MRFLAVAAAAVFSLSSTVAATALTYKLGPNEHSCFYTNAEKKGAKVAFYFAVCPHISGWLGLDSNGIRSNPEELLMSTTK